MRTLTEIHFVSGEKVAVTEPLEEVRNAVAVQNTSPYKFTRPTGGPVYLNGAHITHAFAIED